MFLEARQTESIEEGIDEEVRTLARKLTKLSVNSDGQHPFTSGQGGKLDPRSEDFDYRAWAKAYYNTLKSPDHGSPPRTAGLAFENVWVYGSGADIEYQKTVGNIFLDAVSLVRDLFGSPRQSKVNILHGLEGVLHSGEMLMVLGPPGSGCSTFLRAISGETHGFHLNKDSYLNYEGVRPQELHSHCRGEAIYAAEVDTHIATLPVGDTLYFAARMRAPNNLPQGLTHHQYALQLRDVVMAVFGLSHTIDTRVGNDYIRGVSGGERKRVTIAEATLSGAPLQCWDNSTRGLDSANSIKFCQTLRMQSDIMKATSLVAIYQAPQDAYDLFDKVTVLYEGRQIYYGRTEDAKVYFEELGFSCPERQTTPDFLTSMTSSSERIPKPGYELKVPRSPDEFAEAWRNSYQRQALLNEIEQYKASYHFDGVHKQRFLDSRKADQSPSQRTQSPFTLSFFGQVKLCLWRAVRQFRNDPSVMISSFLMYFFEALIIGSVFYNMQKDTESFFKRGVLLFYVILLNAFSCMLEILGVYATRKVVEKHSRYALYHPSADAVAAVIANLPYKVLNCLFMNTTIYLMSNLRREAGSFFFFLLFTFVINFAMSMFFRLAGSLTKSIEQALAPAAILMLAVVTYTGFAIPKRYMLGWISWVRHINPIAYGFESIMLNEFHGREYSCSQFVPSGPGYDNTAPDQQACVAKGATLGSRIVSGTAFLMDSYDYRNGHKWRNLGIIIAITIGLMLGYLAAIEYISSERSKGEVLVFRRANRRQRFPKKRNHDPENLNDTTPAMNRQEQSNTEAGQQVENHSNVFHWQDVCYDIKIRGEPRRILDHVSGWVKPGTLTALMGVSGAGKTTLLDVLASRVSMGIVTGDMLVNGTLRDDSFQRKTGYVQQQDLHLATSTVREALSLSALLRQPRHIPRQEKLDYVNTVIDLLDMHTYADAVVGVPGEGLNVEQRKRLTIGVELAARPQLLLFLDEPTSGLDSQTSWSISSLMKKLTDNGQAILCTIHQPSAMLFQRFDRLLLLAKGGKTVYFGEIGDGAQTLLNYFMRNGAAPCPAGANPAEYMLNVITGLYNSGSNLNWPEIWNNSPERKAIQDHLQELKQGRSVSSATLNDLTSSGEFAAPFMEQLWQVTKRVFQQYWRDPGYIYAKAVLTVGVAMFVGFSFFKAESTQQGLQNQMFGVFIFLAVALQMITQIIPVFVMQRTLYEARERPSKTYSWKAFMVANIFVELAWNSIMGIFCFLCWYYPIGLWRNAEPTDQVHSRGTLAYLFIWVCMLWSSSLAHLLIAGLETADAASGLATIIFELLLLFCGVVATREALPGFWIFMYRINPLTYLINGLLSTSLANAPMRCASNEYQVFNAPENITCGEYMKPFMSMAGGYLVDEGAETCQYCPVTDTNVFLHHYNAEFDERWRNFGILWGFVVFNIVAALFLYWVMRVPKNRNKD
ncbi:ABC multidrug transporter [Aspergillus caelatus]|uniref:ABC multidrug transporter n=1 Tax=Aspergillus caelatus TaxID=61420 RepID=A0A5N6ZX81_9EURO|nr:ABC multidrug transporter [Aspergillus caelatus]KAE8361546.1 ABC multidrug transporter [Aspergillus caelatus]